MYSVTGHGLIKRKFIVGGGDVLSLVLIRWVNYHYMCVYRNKVLTMEH